MGGDRRERREQGAQPGVPDARRSGVAGWKVPVLERSALKETMLILKMLWLLNFGSTAASSPIAIC